MSPSSSAVPDAVQWLAWYQRLGSAIGAPETVDATLFAATAAAVVTIPGTRSASITRQVGAGFMSVAHHGETALALDRLHADMGEGPCLDAPRQRTVVHSGDVATDERWPAFGAQAPRLGVSSVLSVPVDTDDDVLAALNLYGADPYTFTQESRLMAILLAAQLAVLVTAASRAEQVAGLEFARQSNREIGVAMGVLMQQYRIDRDEAFMLLKTASQNSNRKLRDIATEVADTGELRPPARRASNERRPRG